MLRSNPLREEVAMSAENCSAILCHHCRLVITLTPAVMAERLKTNPNVPYCVTDFLHTGRPVCVYTVTNKADTRVQVVCMESQFPPMKVSDVGTLSTNVSSTAVPPVPSLTPFITFTGPYTTAFCPVSNHEWRVALCTRCHRDVGWGVRPVSKNKTVEPTYVLLTALRCVVVEKYSTFRFRRYAFELSQTPRGAFWDEVSGWSMRKIQAYGPTMLRKWREQKQVEHPEWFVTPMDTKPRYSPTATHRPGDLEWCIGGSKLSISLSPEMFPLSEGDERTVYGISNEREIGGRAPLENHLSETENKGPYIHQNGQKSMDAVFVRWLHSAKLH